MRKSFLKRYVWYATAVVAVFVAVSGVWSSKFFVPHHADAQSPANTVVFGLNVYGYSAQTTAGTSQIIGTGPIVDSSGYAINPSDYHSGTPHKIYLNASSYSVDFRVGVMICQDDGTQCHTAWTPWASDVASGAANPYSAIVGGGPPDGSTSTCGIPEATLHNRLGDIFIGAQTRPLPAGTVLTNVSLTLFPLEWDYNVPVNQAANPSCWNPYDTQVTPGTTPSGGGWSNGAFDKWNNASTDGFVIGMSAGQTVYNAAPVSSNIPTTTSAGQTITTGTDGKQLEITMKNTGTASWPSQKGSATGQGTGTCQVDTNGDGILDAPASTTANYGASCTINYVYNGTADPLAHMSGSFSPSPNPLQYTKIVPIITTYVAPTSTQSERCTYVGGIQGYSPALRGGGGNPFIATAYAMALGGGGMQCFPVTITIPAHYEYYFGASTVVAPGDTVAFPLNNLVAPSSNGSYTETWQMQNSSVSSFGSPFSTTIQVGQAATDTFTVLSTNIVTGGPVTGSWFAFGPVSITSTDKTSDIYSNIPIGSYNIRPIAAPGFALNGVREGHLAMAASDNGNPFVGVVTALRNAFGMTAFAQQSPQQVSPVVCDFSAYSFDASANMYGCPGGPSPTQTVISGSNATSVIMWYPIANMTVAPTSVTLSTTGSGQFTVQNSGSPGSALYWTASTTSSWFTLSPASGSLVNAANQSGTSGASQAVAIVPSSTLAPGTYTGTVNVMGTSLYCDATSHAGCNLQPFSVSVSFTKPVPPLVKSVSETITPDQVAPGGSAQALGTVTYSDGSTDNNVTYSSDNTGVATVDPHTGAIQAKALGTANIEAISNASSSHFATAAILVVNGGGCSGNCSGGNPTVSVTAIPTTISQAETATCHATVTGTASTTVIWSAKNGAIKGSGSTVTLAPSTAPTATCIATLAADSAASGSATVTVVNTTNPLNAPTCSLSANPTSVLIPQATTISYSCKHVSSCTLSGGSFGSQSTVAVNGSTETAVGTTQDSPTQNTVYTITCYGTNTYSSVSSSANVSVTVTNPGRNETNP